MTRDQSYDALLVDLDGTLLDDAGEIRPRNARALRALEASGAHVMIATGRSTVASLHVLDSLELQTPMLVFNGAAIHCPREGRLIEERILSNRVVARAMAHAREHDYLVTAQQAIKKYATEPRRPGEKEALAFFDGLQVVERSDLPTEYVIRLIFYSAVHRDSVAFREEIEEALVDPLFLTDFPLNLLVTHRESGLNVVDVQPPCRGKAEGLRFLQESYGVSADRVVAIGDATNDIDMLRAAGVGVAMEAACERTRACADRVIGSNNSDAIAEVIEELFEHRLR